MLKGEGSLRTGRKLERMRNFQDFHWPLWAGLDVWLDLLAHLCMSVIPIPATQPWLTHGQHAPHEAARDHPYTEQPYNRRQYCCLTVSSDQLIFCLCLSHWGFSELLCWVKGWGRVGAQQAEECAGRRLSKFCFRSSQAVSPPQMCGLSEPQTA